MLVQENFCYRQRKLETLIVGIMHDDIERLEMRRKENEEIVKALEAENREKEFLDIIL